MKIVYSSDLEVKRMLKYVVILAVLSVAVLAIMTLFYKLKIKPALVLYKIKRNKISEDELILEYENTLKKIVFGGSKKYAVVILLCCIADISNYSASFDAIFAGNENMITIFILAITLGIILDQTPSAIADYIFKDEGIQLSPPKRRIINVFMILCASAIISLIIMLFSLRFSTMEITYDSDLPLKAMKSMTTLWSFIAFGTSITSFLYSAINKTVILPMLVRFLKRTYIPLFNMLKMTNTRELDEIKGELENNKGTRVIEREHRENIKVINARVDLLKEVYKCDKESIVRSEEKKNKIISINKVLKDSEKQVSV